MQGFMYSIFSASAIAIHLIINFNLLVGRGETLLHGRSYRGFLFGILAYYVTDACWGLFAGFRWMGAWYVDTIFFFLSLVAFVFMWSRFVTTYLDFGRKSAAILSWFGYAMLAVNVVALAANPFNNCFFYFDADNVYKVGWMRDPAFFLLVAFNFLVAAMSFAKAMRSRESLRRRGMMVFMFGIMMTAAMIFQVIWPLTPFTALGCLIGNCFFHVFVIQDGQAEKHAAELEKALERARAAEKARSMFFSIVSHDIRTPLNAILGYSELLQKDATNQANRDEALKSIRSSGTTLLQLVNDVLDLAKMDAGKMTLRPEPVLLNQLTDEVFSSFSRTAGEKGIKLVNLTKSVPTVMIDGHRFRQILFNLIGNAVKFTSEGSVTVAASYAGGTLDVSVSDTGCGIASDMLTHVLNPFVQVQDPTHAADRAGGTGLGLSICRRLVEVMGGEIYVRSELGKGSTFMVKIPGVEVAEGGVVNSLTQPLPHSPTPSAHRVLVVDDSPVNQKVLAAFLRKAGIASIDLAGDGVEALAKLDASAKAGDPYDFVFSDFWMPNMNGLELIEKLRADSRFSQLPVFAITADTEFHKDSRSRLFNDILLKPITYGRLLEVFKQR
jgi:signal transduction histidine kinase/CheY-like chemotaxis protein